MKKILILLAVVLSAALVFAACTSDTEMDKEVVDIMTSEDDMMEKDDNKDMKDDDMSSGGHDSMTEDEDEAMEENFLDVTMMDIDGNEWNLAKLGDKAVVKVWASWCSICLSGMDEYNTFAGEYEDAQVLTVVSPDMFGEKSKEDFVEWYRGLEDVENIVVILDEGGVLINGLGIRGFPTYVYIDSKGYVDSGAIGHQATADVIERLESIG